MGSWQPIETAPTSEDGSYLVLLPGNEVCDFLIVQVSNFEKQRYPDHKDGLIDWNDRITTATHWMPVPELSKVTNE